MGDRCSHRYDRVIARSPYFVICPQGLAEIAVTAIEFAMRQPSTGVITGRGRKNRRVMLDLIVTIITAAIEPLGADLTIEVVIAAQGH